MAVINWYPGHMTKSIRMIEENVKLIDVLVYVLDARAPKSCINPDFIKYVSRLPVVYVLNKCDLADDAQTALWVKKLKGEKARLWRRTAQCPGVPTEFWLKLNGYAAKK